MQFLLKVYGGQVEYERQLVRPSSAGTRLGVTERGTGTVTSSGEVSPTGSAAHSPANPWPTLVAGFCLTMVGVITLALKQDVKR